jgi:hypothetical protein
MIAMVPRIGVAQNSLAVVNTSKSQLSSSAGTGLSMYEFRTDVSESDLNTIPNDQLENHVFVDLVARKMYLLKTKYIYEVQTVPGNPRTKTMIRKPVIYDAVFLKPDLSHFAKLRTSMDQVIMASMPLETVRAEMAV